MRRAAVWTLAAAVASAACSAPKHLVEFGWDEPDTAFLRRHIRQMETTPFDGCVFHASAPSPDGKGQSLAWKVWGRRAFTAADVAPALADLKATDLGRFRELFLRVNVTPGDLDWFDDFAAVLENVSRLAGVAHQGGARGLLFDTEAYEGAVFDVRRQPQADRHSWDEYATQARHRGRQVAEAIEAGFPEATVMLTFGYELPWRESMGGTRPLAECRYGLLAPFLDGLVEAARSMRLVNGYEFSYGFKEPRQFWEGYDVMRRRVRPLVANARKYQRVSSMGFGLWLDYDQHVRGWDEVAHDNNHFTPTALETALDAALDTADRYVWLYSERVRWWTEEGGTAHLPPAYEMAVRRAAAEHRRR
jgi:hypothetical protein